VNAATVQLLQAVVPLWSMVLGLRITFALFHRATGVR
jgi:hypothetical protein